MKGVRLVVATAVRDAVDVSINKRSEATNMEARVQAALDYIRPALNEDGGDIKLIAVDEASGRVEVALFGACDGCPIASATMTQGVERIIQSRVPGVTEVVAV
jgi:Fe-S cluster biogenesis protein NfuA